MSRGLGKIQRAVLAVIEGSTESSLDTFVIARMVYGVKPDDTGFHLLTDAQVVSVRRALRGLQKLGKVGRLGRFNTCIDGRWVMLNREHWATQNKVAESDVELAALSLRFKRFLPAEAAGAKRTLRLG